MGEKRVSGRGHLVQRPGGKKRAGHVKSKKETLVAGVQ